MQPMKSYRYSLDKDGCAAVIRSWDRLPSGKFGPVQKVL